MSSKIFLLSFLSVLLGVQILFLGGFALESRYSTSGFYLSNPCGLEHGVGAGTKQKRMGHAHTAHCCCAVVKLLVIQQHAGCLSINNASHKDKRKKTEGERGRLLMGTYKNKNR